MTTPINLNKARKARQSVKNRKQADENAVKFGRSKAERILDATRNDKARAAIDRHRFEDEDGQ